MNAWQTNAAIIAEWTLSTMVNRTDVWGIYGLWIDGDGVEHLTRTGPAKKNRGKVSLTIQTLVNHYTGEEVIGLHSTTAIDTCRWMAFDIDAHNDADVAAKNWADTLKISDRLNAKGLSHIIEDSNGKGGIHIWCIFNGPAPSPDIFLLAQDIATAAGVACECFPKQAKASETSEGYGNYLRLPGKHYKRDHWSRVWNGTEWLREDAAIQHMMQTPLNPTDKIPPAPLEPEAFAPANAAIHSNDPDKDIQVATAALNHIPNTFHYDDWLRVGMILKDVAGDSGFELFNQWSATNTQKYDAKITRQKWNSFTGRAKKKVGLGTLVNWAKSHGYTPPREETYTDGFYYNAYDANGGEAGVNSSRIESNSSNGISLNEHTTKMNGTATLAPLETTARPRTEPVNVVVSASRQVTLSYIPPFVPFDLALLPLEIARYIEAAAKSKSTSPEFIVGPMLSAAAAAIGMSRKIIVKPGYEAHAVIWSCFIGRTGTVKTPALAAASFVNHEITREAEQKFYEETQAFKEAEEEYERQKKNRLSSAKKPEPPIEQQYVGGDVTIESLIMLLKNNQRGVLLECDEMAGWFKSFGAYKQGRGGDREHWLNIWNSKPFHVNRKTGDVKHVSVRPSATSLTGGIQPSILKEIFADKQIHESGTTARFLFAYPPEVPNLFNLLTIPQESIDAVRKIIRGLFSLQPAISAFGDPTPVAMPVSKAGQEYWMEFQAENELEKAGFDLTTEEHLNGIWSKTPEHAARLSLVINCLNHVCGTAPGNQIDDVNLAMGIEIAKWFRNEARRVHQLLYESPELQRIRENVEYLKQRGGRITTRDWRHQIFRFRNSAIFDREINMLLTKKLAVKEFNHASEEGGRPSEIIRLVADVAPEHIPTKKT